MEDSGRTAGQKPSQNARGIEFDDFSSAISPGRRRLIGYQFCRRRIERFAGLVLCVISKLSRNRRSGDSWCFEFPREGCSMCSTMSPCGRKDKMLGARRQTANASLFLGALRDLTIFSRAGQDSPMRRSVCITSFSTRQVEEEPSRSYVWSRDGHPW
jgi:hypothetical protein